MADVALVAEETAPQVFDQMRHGPAVVHIARRQVAREQLAAVVDDEVELKAVKPAHTALPPPGGVEEDFVLRDAQVVADGQSRRVHERDARTRAEAGVEVAPERGERVALQLDEALVADEARERPGPLLHHLLGVEGFEVAVARQMKEHEDGHHLGERERAGVATAESAAGQQPPPPGGFKEQTEVVYVAEQGYNIHQENSLRGKSVVLVDDILPRFGVLFPYLELTLNLSRTDIK